MFVGIDSSYLPTLPRGAKPRFLKLCLRKGLLFGELRPKLYLGFGISQTHEEIYYFNVVGFSCKFDDEEIIDGVDYLFVDIDLSMILNRI